MTKLQSFFKFNIQVLFGISYNKIEGQLMKIYPKKITTRESEIFPELKFNKKIWKFMLVIGMT